LIDINPAHSRWIDKDRSSQLTPNHLGCWIPKMADIQHDTVNVS